MDYRKIMILESMTGTRLDALVSKLFGFSRSFSSELICSGKVLLDGFAQTKSGRVKAGQTLEVTWKEPEELEVISTPVADLKIIFQDKDLVIVDKPIGVAAHPAKSWDGPTALGALLAKNINIETSGSAERIGIVQRLDVGTSGLMVIAKTELAYSRLKDSFRKREVTKIYHSIVQGKPNPSEGTIDGPIARHPKSSWKFAVVDGGKTAVTHYQMLEELSGSTLIKISLETGRTHQIRVHMAAQKHPCVGDPLYGADLGLAKRLNLSRQWLHSKELSFEHPRTGNKVFYTSSYPDDLENAYKALKC